MNNHLTKLLDKLYAINHIEMALYSEDDKLIKLYASNEFYPKIYKYFLGVEENKTFIKKEGQLGIYNLIIDKKSNNKIIVGPFIIKDLDEKAIANIKYFYSLTNAEIDTLESKIYDSTSANYITFLHFSSLLNYLLNDEDINIVDAFFLKLKRWNQH